MEINVLDHGLVRLIDHMGDDLSIVRNARVSYDAAWRAGEDEGSDTRLLRYLYNNKHNTPFEAVTLTFEVKAPIFVLRQWHRHRTQSYNELSARYRELPDTWYVPELNQITTQHTDNKQMRTDIVNPSSPMIQLLIDENNAAAYDVYKELIDLGCPREIARSVLPMGMYSHMFCTMNLHNCFGFLRERLHDHAQYEIRVYAQAILKLLAGVAPISQQIFINSLGEGYESSLSEMQRIGG